MVKLKSEKGQQQYSLSSIYKILSFYVFGIICMCLYYIYDLLTCICFYSSDKRNEQKGSMSI
jgi:hypothetical protein